MRNIRNLAALVVLLALGALQFADENIAEPEPLQAGATGDGGGEEPPDEQHDEDEQSSAAAAVPTDE